MSLTSELATLIQTAGVPSTSIFRGRRANLPRDTSTNTGPFVSIIEAGGTNPEYTRDLPGVAYVHPSVSITVRHASSDTARALARTIYNALAAVENQTVDTTYYVRLYPRQEPFDMGLDDVGRAQFTFNVLADKRPS